MHATVHYFHFSFFSSKEEQERRSKLEKELEDARSDIKVKAVHIAFTQSTFWKASICEWCLLALFTVYVWKCKMWDLIFMIYDKWLEKHVLFGLHHKIMPYCERAFWLGGKEYNSFCLLITLRFFTSIYLIPKTELVHKLYRPRREITYQ